jgi:AcrR family transcriptional regulator
LGKFSTLGLFPYILIRWFYNPNALLLQKKSSEILHIQKTPLPLQSFHSVFVIKDTKEHIIKTAFLLFLEKSYKAVTLKDIIHKTGLSNGAFYHYFKSKEQLHKEVIETYLFRMARRIYGYRPQNSLWDFIQDALKSAEAIHKEIDDFLLNGNGYNYLIFMFEAIRNFSEMREEINKIHKMEFATWVEIIEIAKAKGEIRDDHPAELLARMFIYVPDGSYLEFMLDGNIAKYTLSHRRLWEGLYNMVKA